MEFTLCGKMDFPNHKQLHLAERIRSLWEQILSFKSSFHFERERNRREPLLDPTLSHFDVRNFSAFWLRH